LSYLALPNSEEFMTNGHNTKNLIIWSWLYTKCITEHWSWKLFWIDKKPFC